MKQLIYILTLTFGLLSCSGGSENRIETKSVDTIPKVIRTSKQMVFLKPMPDDVKKKECYKSTLALDTKLSSKKFPFDNWLTEVLNQDLILKFKEKSDGFRKSFIPNNNKLSFNTTDKWILTYYLVENSYGCQPNQAKVTESYFSSKANKYLLSGQDIFEIYNISDKDFPLNYFPMCLNRHAKYNCEWTAILPDNNTLIIRFVNSYPDGNQTCFNYEKIYQFTKANE